MLPDAKQGTQFTRMHCPELPGKGCWEAGAWIDDGSRQRHLYSIRKPRATGGEIQSAGLSGCASQSPAEEDARRRKNNDVCGEERGLASLQMSLQPRGEGAVHV